MIIRILTILFISLTLSQPLLWADEEQIFKTYLWNEVRSLEPGIRPKIAIVLGGGGARGLAHIGVIKVFQQEGIPIDMVVGTSVGSLIGSLYVSGYTVEKMEHMAEDMGWGKLTNLSLISLINLISGEKLLSSERMEQYIFNRIGNKRFDELNKPFACIAADIQTGEKIVFREGEIASAVRASSTIPGVFHPVSYRHRLLVDGGIVDNLPADIAKMMGADIIIGITLESDFSDSNTEKVLLVLTQAIYIQGNLLAKEQERLTDIMIMPKLGNISGMDLSRANECIEAGVQATRLMVPQIKDLIMERTFDRIFLGKK